MGGANSAAAIQALLTYVARLLHLSADMSHLAEAILESRAQCDRAVARDRGTREHVRKLEQEYDAAADEERQPSPAGELSGDAPDPVGFLPASPRAAIA